MGINEMILCGHSLGGYVAAKYTKYHPERVSSVLLISPAGVWKAPPTLKKHMNGIANSSNFMKRYLFKKTLLYWSPGKSPMELLRYLGPFASLFVKFYVKTYYKLTKQEGRDVAKYLFQILMKPGTGEYAMSYILSPVLFT